MRDVAPQPSFVVIADVGQLDPEVLARPEVDLFSEEVEDHEQRLFRDFLLLLDLRAHV